MTARSHAALLRGLIGALSFLVLAQGYRLQAGGGPGLPALLVVALAVGVAAALLSEAAGRALRSRRE